MRGLIRRVSIPRCDCHLDGFISCSIQSNMARASRLRVSQPCSSSNSICRVPAETLYCAVVEAVTDRAPWIRATLPHATAGQKALDVLLVSVVGMCTIRPARHLAPPEGPVGGVDDDLGTGVIVNRPSHTRLLQHRG